nr:BspA family leucine-rich repeat surface protein [Mycoplasmopsis bovis]
MGIENWDTSNISNLSETFSGADKLSIKTYQIEKLQMLQICQYTFYNAKKFNSPLNSWDTYNVTNMQSMFYGACWIQSRTYQIEKQAMLQICHLCSNGAAKFDKNISWNDMSKKLLNHNNFCNNSRIKM